jgi:hypothetical protein
MLRAGGEKMVDQCWRTTCLIRVTIQKQLAAGFSERIREDARAVPFKIPLRSTSLASKLAGENEKSDNMCED